MKIFAKKNAVEVGEKAGGFTLVETMVAITVLLLAVTAAFSAAQSGLSGSYYANEEITAFYLAQDAVEFVREIRDHNPSASWLAGLEPCVSGKCAVDSYRETVDTCAEGVCGKLFLKTGASADSGIYGYSNQSSTETPFTREVSIAPLSDNEARLNVTIKWNSKGKDQSFSVRENIYNFR